MEIRPYDPAESGDPAALWRLKQAFERELAASTDDEAKGRAYENKLDDEYRKRYLEWVARCVNNEERTIPVAQLPPSACGGSKVFVAYAFVLPERLAMVWDAAVLNEIYVAPDHRGTGLADDMMARVFDVAQAQNLPLDRLILDVAPENERARGFYDRHGFEPWGELVAKEL